MTSRDLIFSISRLILDVEMIGSNHNVTMSSFIVKHLEVLPYNRS